MNLFRPTVILKIKFSFGDIHLLLRLVYFWKIDLRTYNCTYIQFIFLGCQINWPYISCFIPRNISRRWMHCNRCWRRNTQVGSVVYQLILNRSLGFGMYSVRPVRHVSHSLFSICLMESDKWLQLIILTLLCLVLVKIFPWEQFKSLWFVQF